MILTLVVRERQNLIKHYYPETDCIIFVIDSTENDQDWIKDTKDMIFQLQKEAEFKDTMFLFFAHKQDLTDKKSVQEVIDLYELEKIKNDWFIMPTSVKTGEGIKEGLKQMFETFYKKGNY